MAVSLSLLRGIGSALLLTAIATCARAQGGPPFRTDDPETPGNKHWEINFGWIGDRNPASGAYQVPDFDINYGLGDRIQLKYELPIAIEEGRPLSATDTYPAQAASVVVGLGNSLMGVKWRFYQHHPGDNWLRPTKPTKSEAGPNSERPVDFSISTYPQLTAENPTSSVARGVVPAGPDFLLPIEVNGRIGPIRLDGEVGYHFGNQTVPQSWIRGLLVGHEFTDRTEAYLELYDQQDANTIPAGRGVGQFATGQTKQRETTLGAGGRQALNKRKTVLLMLMGGRSFQAITPTNGQPSWIAYVGLQILLGPEEPVTPQVEQKLPNEDRK
jgi:hypothetical protein